MKIIGVLANIKQAFTRSKKSSVQFYNNSNYYSSYSNVNALKNSDIFTAVHVLSSSIATAKIEKFLDNKITNDSIVKLFNSRPNDFMNAYDFKYVIAANMLLNGEAFVKINIDEDGSVDSLTFLNNSSVTIKTKEQDIIYSVSLKNETIDLTQSEILHFKYMTIDGFNCYSPLYSLVQELEISNRSNNFLTNFFKNASNSSGVLKMNFAKLNDEQKDEVRNSFEKLNSGSNNSGKIAIIDPSADYQQLKIPTEILDFLNSYTFTTKQVAKAFNLPIDRLGGENQHTSMNDSNNVYVTDTLIPFFSTLTSEIEFKLYDTNNLNFTIELKFNYQYLYDSDYSTKVKNYSYLVSNRIISANEAREKLGFDRINDSTADELKESPNDKEVII